MRQQDHVLTPHGLFRLSNPQAVVPGRLHVVRYHPSDQFATESGMLPTRAEIVQQLNEAGRLVLQGTGERLVFE